MVGKTAARRWSPGEASRSTRIGNCTRGMVPLVRPRLLAPTTFPILSWTHLREVLLVGSPHLYICTASQSSSSSSQAIPVASS